MSVRDSPLSRQGVRLVPVTLDLLGQEEVSGQAVADALGVSGPDTWPPMFNGPETRAWVRDRLQMDPKGVQWYSWYIIADIEDRPTLSGIAGYKGPPGDGGVVEIGYAVVESCQGRGIASTAVALLCDRAFALGVSAVAAHTLPALLPSQRVLHKAGFRKVQVLDDPDEGVVWRYRLDQPEARDASWPGP